MLRQSIRSLFQPLLPGSAGWLPGRNFLSRYLQKSKYSEPREKNGAGDFEGELIRFGSEQFRDWQSVLKYLL